MLCTTNLQGANTMSKQAKKNSFQMSAGLFFNPNFE